MPQQDAVSHSYNTDTKPIRIPIDVKDALDKARPAGIELWKFAADVITIGLIVMKEFRNSKEYHSVTKYEITELLAGPMQEVLGKHAKR